MQLHKDMYYKLQNIEQHPEVLPEARKILISFFSEVLTTAHKDLSNAILSIQTFEPEFLARFLQSEDESITKMGTIHCTQKSRIAQRDVQRFRARKMVV